MTSTTENRSDHVNPDELPFVAPCKQLDTQAPFRWLQLGWTDIKRAPRQSLTYGAALTLLSYLVTFMVYQFGNLGLLVSIISGFVILGPVLAIGLYSISCQIKEGLEPQLGYCLREGRRHLSNELIFAVILTVVFLIWARAASMIHIFFPDTANPDWTQYVAFFSVGIPVGALFSAIIFCFSAFSLPMIMDRKVDVVTAVITSINAALRNKKVMLIWAVLIVSIVLLGFMTAYLGFIILMPLVGHATWHAYQETINSDSWPKHDSVYQ